MSLFFCERQKSIYLEAASSGNSEWRRLRQRGNLSLEEEWEESLGWFTGFLQGMPLRYCSWTIQLSSGTTKFPAPSWVLVSQRSPRWAQESARRKWFQLWLIIFPDEKRESTRRKWNLVQCDSMCDKSNRKGYCEWFYLRTSACRL